MAVVESVLHLVVLWLYYVVQRTINSCTIVTSFDRWTCDVETQSYCWSWSFDVGVLVQSLQDGKRNFECYLL